MALKLQVWNSVKLIILKHEYFVFDVITIEKKKKQNLTNCVHLADINYNGTNMTLNLVLSRYFRTFFITFYAIRLIIDNPLHSHTCAKNNSCMIAWFRKFAIFIFGTSTGKKMRPAKLPNRCPSGSLNLNPSKAVMINVLCLFGYMGLRCPFQASAYI